MYEVDLDPVAEHERDALPVEGQEAYMELQALLEISPWSGEPHKAEHPDRNMRRQVFGAGRGMATYLVMEERRLVYIVRITWV